MATLAGRYVPVAWRRRRRRLVSETAGALMRVRGTFAEHGAPVCLSAIRDFRPFCRRPLYLYTGRRARVPPPAPARRRRLCRDVRPGGLAGVTGNHYARPNPAYVPTTSRRLTFWARSCRPVIGSDRPRRFPRRYRRLRTRLSVPLRKREFSRTKRSLPGGANVAFSWLGDEFRILHADRANEDGSNYERIENTTSSQRRNRRHGPIHFNVNVFCVRSTLDRRNAPPTRNTAFWLCVFERFTSIWTGWLWKIFVVKFTRTYSADASYVQINTFFIKTTFQCRVYDFSHFTNVTILHINSIYTH